MRGANRRPANLRHFSKKHLGRHAEQDLSDRLEMGAACRTSNQRPGTSAIGVEADVPQLSRDVSFWTAGSKRTLLVAACIQSDGAKFQRLSVGCPFGDLGGAADDGF